MNRQRILQVILFVTFFALTFVPCQGATGGTSKGLIGDWQIRTESEDDGSREYILSLSEDKEGTLTGQWISVGGISELSDTKLEGNQLSFKWNSSNRGTESVSEFSGSWQTRELTGILTSQRGERKVQGQRIRPMVAAMGTWKIKAQANEKLSGMLVIMRDEKGRLTGQWTSEKGETAVTDLNFKKGALTFTRSITTGNFSDAVFEGTIKKGTLTGIFKFDGKEIEAQGERIGAAIIGSWDLELTSDRGSRKQVLAVHPDLSGRYGPLPIEKITFENDNVSFTLKMEAGDQSFEMNFLGILQNSILKGQMTSSRSTWTAVGHKQNRGQAGLNKQQIKKASREPDVIYVPTPQKVVDRMLELAKVTKEDLVYDLGCGDGRIVVTAAKKYGCRGIGYDINPKRIRESLANVVENGVEDLVTIEQADIFTLDLSSADVITLYLLPELNVRLIPQLEKLRPGSRIVSHDFDMEGIRPQEVIEIEDAEDEYGDHTIYLWVTPLQREDTEDP